MAHLKVVTVLALLVSVSVAQRYSTGSNNGNYVDDYDYDNGSPAPRPASPSRSFSSAPAPARSSVPAGPRPTPVPILKQINRHNEDGSYTYGYEGADGSFKIETKLNTGEVMGKYGYVDDTGKVRVVEYGANRYGFQPSGEGITVAPPTLVDESKNPRNGEPDYEDGQYYEQPAARAPQRPQIQAPRAQPRPAPQPARPAPVPLRPSPQAFRPAPQPAPQPARAAPPQPAGPSPQYSTFEEYADEPQYRPAPQQQAPQPRFSQSPGPVPPRIQVPGAVPAGGVVYSSPQHSQSRPAPPRPAQQHQTPIYHAQPIASTASPLPPPPPPSRAVPRPAPQTRQAGSGGLLDQLARDYALPQGGIALSDVSFGYYS